RPRRKSGSPAPAIDANAHPIADLLGPVATADPSGGASPMLLARMLRPLIRIGRLTVVDADGRSHVFGTDTEPAVTVRLHDRSLHWRLALNPGLHAGEAWMDGTLTVEDASLQNFLDLLGRNLACSGQSDIKGPLHGLRRLLRRVSQFNPAPRARRNVENHY